VIFTVPLQLSYLNSALQHFEAQFVVPALQAFWSLSSITTGALFFNEFDSYSAADIGMFVGGVVLSSIGVVLLSARKQPEQSGMQAAALAAVSSKVILETSKSLRHLDSVRSMKSVKDVKSPRSAKPPKHEASQISFEEATISPEEWERRDAERRASRGEASSAAATRSSPRRMWKWRRRPMADVFLDERRNEADLVRSDDTSMMAVL